MGRLIITVVLGSVLMYAWQFMSWTVLGLHNTSGGSHPQEAELMSMLRETTPEAGMYWLPMWPDDETLDAEAMQAAMDAFDARHREGPRAVLMYSPEGAVPMAPVKMGIGFGLNVGAVLLGCLLLTVGGVPGFFGRVVFFLLVGALFAVATDLIHWNYMLFPMDATIVNIIDHGISWGLVGLAAGVVMRPGAPAFDAEAGA